MLPKITPYAKPFGQFNELISLIDKCLATENQVSSVHQVGKEVKFNKPSSI